MSSGRRRRQPVLDGRPVVAVRTVDQEGTDPHRAQVMDRELEHRGEHCGIAMRAFRSDRGDPGPNRGFVVPAVAVPTRDAERADDAHDAARMALHDRRVECLGEHDEIALRSGGAIEDDPLVVVVDTSQQPARQPVGEAARGGQRLVIEGLASDLEPGRLTPNAQDRRTPRRSCRCSAPGVRAPAVSGRDRSPRATSRSLGRCASHRTPLSSSSSARRRRRPAPGSAMLGRYRRRSRARPMEVPGRAVDQSGRRPTADPAGS